MYPQTMPRTISGGQLNTMMTHTGMMMTSSQPHMINPVSLACRIFSLGVVFVDSNSLGEDCN